MNWKACYLLLIFTVAFSLLCSSCSMQGENEKGTAIEYTVVAEDELPKELKTIIDQKKEGEFKLTYADGEFLYIAVGYGKQTTGGYSIQIPEVYLKDGNIVFVSQLLGPKGDAKVNISYPYAVVKIEKREEPVLFE